MKIAKTNPLYDENFADLVSQAANRAMAARKSAGIELDSDGIEEVSDAISLIGNQFRNTSQIKFEKFYVAGGNSGGYLRNFTAEFGFSSGFECFSSLIGNIMCHSETHLCPSAPCDSPEANIFGIVVGSVEQLEVFFLDKPVKATEALLALAKPATSKEVFRVSAPCSHGKCSHFDCDSNQCRLVEKLVRIEPKTLETLSVCAIREACKWLEQEGKEACLRCPQIATLDLSRPDKIANPTLF